MAGLEFRQKG